MCGGKGHSAEVCAISVTVLACENIKSSNDESDAAISGEEEEAFICDMSDEYNDESIDEEGCSALAWQVGDLTVICDSGASCHMSHSATGMLNYRGSNAYMRTASGSRYPIEGYGHLPLTFRSSFGDIPLLLRNVAHVPKLNYHLLSLRAVADSGHSYTGTQEGVTVFFSTGDTLFFSSVGRLNFLYAYRPGMLVDEIANATNAPGLSPSNVTPPLTSMTFTLPMPMPMPTRERYARRPSKWALPWKESCMSAKAARWKRGSACLSHPRRTAAKDQRPRWLGRVMRADRTERRVRQTAKARRRMESRCQKRPQARSRRPRLKRLPRSHRGGLQHLLQEPGAANAGFHRPGRHDARQESRRYFGSRKYFTWGR